MRTISLRQFRDHIADITEPVEVQRRDKAGNFQILGRWVPLSSGAPVVDWPVVNLDLGSGPEPVEVRYLGERTPKSQQAERDRILKRVNRGG